MSYALYFDTDVVFGNVGVDGIVIIIIKVAIVLIVLANAFNKPAHKENIYVTKIDIYYLFFIFFKQLSMTLHALGHLSSTPSN